MSIGFLTETDQQVLAGVVDELIPGGLGMPTASEARVPDVWAEEVLVLRTDLRPDFFRGMRLLEKYREQALASLQKEDPVAFNALGVVVAGGYFLNPEIRSLIGYPGQESRTYDSESTPDYVADGLLQAVLDRGPIYRR